MVSEEILKWILAINAGSLIAVLSFGFKIVRFFNRIEFKTDLLWRDYERRMGIRNDENVEDQ